MKYVSLTFDDGREDNYSVAFPVMKRYGIPGTVYVATGFADGTWKGFPILQSPRRALTPEEIRFLNENGWEIGLHGDQHTTQRADFETAYEKMNRWLLDGAPEKYGFSVPNSSASDAEIEAIRAMKDKTAYIRKGRRKSNAGIAQKALYALSYYGGMQWAYNLYNRDNTYEKRDRGAVMYSVVVKDRDKPGMILRFLDQLPDGARVALMLHSVLPTAEAQQKKSVWNWTENRLDALCAGLIDRKGQVQAVTAARLSQE